MSVQGFKFALDPTPRQVGDLHRHAGAARVAFNWGSARIKANLSQRQAERSYGIGEDELTEAVGWSLYALRRDWNQAKQTPPRGGPSARRRRTTRAWTSSRGA